MWIMSSHFTPARYPVAGRVVPPLSKWEVNSYRFGQDCSYPTENGPDKHWGIHLGADTNCAPSTPVNPISSGVCIYRGIRPGTSKDDRNWGGLIILCHFFENVYEPLFGDLHGNGDGQFYRVFSLYGHLTSLNLSLGEIVYPNDIIGRIGCAMTSENGWWEDAHLHFGILLDPMRTYQGGILRGYAHDEAPNRLLDWEDPVEFFQDPKASIRKAEQERIRTIEGRYNTGKK